MGIAGAGRPHRFRRALQERPRVVDPEPLPKGHPLWKTGRVIITPHIAGRSDGEGPRYFEIYKDNLIRFANGEPLRHAVDKEKGY